MSKDALLSLEDLYIRYGAIEAVKGIALSVGEGEIVTLVGANGAGKSSILRAISGLVPFEGRILHRGQDLRHIPPHRIVSMGVAHVPEGRGIFASLKVIENLKLATWPRKDKPEIAKDYKRVFALFPVLYDRREQSAGTLSGGEQQMLAVARALMTRGCTMLLDEPSMGLSPVLVQDIFSVLREINQAGTTILLVEQNARMALRAASFGYVLETGTITLSGSGADLLASPLMQAAYLG